MVRCAVKFVSPLCCAEEGDLRLVDEEEVGAWQVGRLEVFFEGSWGQVCGGAFNAPDAIVACRQLGFATGAPGPLRRNLGGIPSNMGTGDRPVYHKVAITSPGCTGTEARLVDCPTEADSSAAINPGFNILISGCFDVSGPGLSVACARGLGSDTGVVVSLEFAADQTSILAMQLAVLQHAWDVSRSWCSTRMEPRSMQQTSTCKHMS